MAAFACAWRQDGQPRLTAVTLRYLARMALVSLLMVSLLFGGMTLFSFGFAAVLFQVYDAPLARQGIRGAFPYYYLFVIATAGACAAALAPVNPVLATLLGLVALTTLYARQILMAQINAATDAGDKKRFGMLHGASVILQLAQIGVTGYALVQLS